MSAEVPRVIGLLAVAILVAIAARRLRLPYTVGLVATGIALALGRIGGGIALTHEFLFDVALPPLLFEGALHIPWRELRRDLVPVLTLSVLGVVVSAAVVAGGMRLLLDWPAAPAAVFGVLIGATDPVGVIALFKDMAVKGRVRLLVESESLINDGVAAALFALVIAWATAGGGEPATVTEALRTLALVVGGGITAGLGCALVAIAVAGRSPDRLVEAAVTAVAAYGSFLLAERVGGSGVLATVTAGLVVSNLGMRGEVQGNPFSVAGRALVISFWEFAAFVANSLVFLLIGLTVARTGVAGLGVKPLAVAVALVLAGRAAAVYPLCFLLRRTSVAVSRGEQHVLWWGGLRGALALALALALPPSLADRDSVVIATFGVVVFSVLVQGLTVPALLRRLTLAPPDVGDGGET